SAGAGTSTIAWGFTNTVTLSALSGTLALSGSSNVIGGTLTANGGALTLGGSGTINPLTLTANSQAGVTGNYTFNPGTYVLPAGPGLNVTAGSQTAGRTLTSAGPGALTALGGASAVTNNGTFAKTGGSGTTTVNWGFTNAGTVSGQSGTLAFAGSLSNNGTLTASGGTVAVRSGAAFSNFDAASGTLT